MRNTVIAVGLFVCSLITLTAGSASALSPAELLASASVARETDTVQRQDGMKSDRVESIISEAMAKVTEVKPEPQEKSKPRKHVVAQGDTLSSIAKAYDTTWERLYDKNNKISAPDMIVPGQSIVIPEPNETLKKRPAPVAVQSQTIARNTGSAANTTEAPQSQTIARGSASGNSYYAGYCTWYAKSRRPDMPNNLGNANTWVARAAAQGFATGSRPQAGAIGQQGMHVVYVERVNSNGTVTVSEMNYQGYGVVSSRTVPAGTFMYIY
jgi:surface antigen